MKRIRKNQKLKSGDAVSFDMYADGSLTTVNAEVVQDSGELVSVYYYHPIYPEAGVRLKALNKRQLFKL
jgi:hypothetical protein